LLAVNGVLLILLGAVTLGPSTLAQNRVRGDYTMVAGGVNGAMSGVVYVVDTANQELMAVTFDPNQKSLMGIGYRNLGGDIASVQLGPALRRGALDKNGAEAVGGVVVVRYGFNPLIFRPVTAE